MGFFAKPEEGFYKLTGGGFGILIIIGLLLFGLGLFFLSRKLKLGMVQLCFSLIAFILALALGSLKVFTLPFNGEVTLFSLLLLVLLGNWYGMGMGFFASASYGVFHLLLTGAVFLSLPQLIVDNVLSFSVAGIAGLFHKNKRQGLTIGYVAALLGRLIFILVSGNLFLSELSMAETVPEVLRGKPLLYSLAVNGAPLLFDALLTLIIINLPPVAAAFIRLKELALSGSIQDMKKKKKKPEQIYDERREEKK